MNSATFTRKRQRADRKDRTSAITSVDTALAIYAWALQGMPTPAGVFELHISVLSSAHAENRCLSVLLLYVCIHCSYVLVSSILLLHCVVRVDVLQFFARLPGLQHNISAHGVSFRAVPDRSAAVLVSVIESARLAEFVVVQDLARKPWRLFG